MGITSISGELIIMVDEVMIEQINLARPEEVLHFPVALQAMVAALHSETAQGLLTQLSKYHHTLEYSWSEKIGNDWMVHFKMRRQHHEEMGSE